MNDGQTPDKAGSGMHVSGSHGSDSAGEANLHVLDVMRRAEQELRHLIEERGEVTKRIGTVKRTIVSLVKLFGEGMLDGDLLSLFDGRGGRQPGITSTCRRVLMEARRPMSAREVCDEIQKTVPALLARHQDPMATINTILGRLVQYGEATVRPGDRGQRVWLWAADREGRASHALEGDGSIPAI